MSRATECQVAEWTARAAHYRREGHSGVAGILEEMLAALGAAEARAKDAESRLASLDDPNICACGRWSCRHHDGEVTASGIAAADRLLAALDGEATDVPE